MKKTARLTIASMFMLFFFMAVVNSVSSQFSPDKFHFANIIPVSAPEWPGNIK